MSKKLALSTIALHGDDPVALHSDVSAPISVSTTFKRSEQETSGGHVYSRESQPIRLRCETIIGALEGGHAAIYASGLAAIFAAIYHYNPKRVLINGGYFGTHAIINGFKAKFNLKIAPLEEEEPREGDLLWLETPKNPCCIIEDIQALSEKAHAVKAVLVVDSTFAPPPLQYGLKLGADMVMHSTTKYFGGHSDMLGGVLIVKNSAQQKILLDERNAIGSVPGSLETWLLLRSLRTLELRVVKQSQSAAILAAWLNSGKAPYVTKVWHPSLPTHPRHDIAKKQMNGLYGGVLSVELDNEHRAVVLPERLKLFHDATSLGGVESLIEWRHRCDPTISKNLLRVSVGLEDVNDLISDFHSALLSLSNVSSSKL